MFNKFFPVLISSLLVLAGGASAATDDVKASCLALDRPNIDCSCVAKRVETFADAGGFDAGAAYLAEAYKNLLGQEHEMKSAFEAMQGDTSSWVNFNSAMDGLGGEPDTISEFEEGCVVAGAEPPVLPPIPPASTLANAVEVCKASGAKSRYCQCSAVRERAVMSEAEFEAMTRDIADWVGLDIKSADENNKSHAEIMGISQAAFDGAVSSAAVKRGKHIDQIANYCTAMTWADKEPGMSEATRKLAGFEPGVAEAAIAKANAGPSVMTTESNDLVRARMIIADGCPAKGNSEGFCQCVASEFRTKLVPAAGSTKKAFGWAFLSYGSDALPASDFMAEMQALSTSGEMDAIAVMFGTAPDIDGMCHEQQRDASKPKDGLEGTPFERQMQICTADGGDTAVCACTTNQMKDAMGPDDFELFVDMSEAQHLGYDDPFEKIANDRGLTKDEATQAIMMNQQLMAQIMTMDPLACAAGMGLPSNLTNPQ